MSVTGAAAAGPAVEQQAAGRARHGGAADQVLPQGALAEATPDAERRLRLVPAARTVAPRGPYVALIATLLVLGLGGLLLLNTVVAQDAFTLHSLKLRSQALTEQSQQLQQQVDELSTPSALAAEARRLGMVEMPAPAFLRLSDGAVLGDPQPAKPETPPAGAARTGPDPAAGDAAPGAAGAGR